MLNLASETDPSWTRRALDDLDAILIDHAHCEKKAASTALSLIFKYVDLPQLQKPLSELAREELRHFEEVLGHLDRLGITFGRQKPSPYAGRLMEVRRAHEPDRLVDTLLCCALIEARSCERMQLLAEALEDGPLKKLYGGLLASEARHHNTYVQLADTIAPPAEVRQRLAEIAEHEAQVIAEAPAWARMHT